MMISLALRMNIRIFMTLPRKIMIFITKMMILIILLTNMIIFMTVKRKMMIFMTLLRKMVIFLSFPRKMMILTTLILEGWWFLWLYTKKDVKFHDFIEDDNKFIECTKEDDDGSDSHEDGRDPEGQRVTGVLSEALNILRTNFVVVVVDQFTFNMHNTYSIRETAKKFSSYWPGH